MTRRCTSLGRVLAGIGLLLCFNGCAVWHGSTQLGALSTLPSRVLLDEVPFFAQHKYQCGPAALAMALSWSGAAVTPDDLTATVYSPGRKGTLQANIITAVRRNGRLAYPIKGLTALVQEVAAGHPVVVFQNLGLGWWPRWHYAVVVGYDLSKKQVVLHTGTTAFRTISLSTFDHTWRRAQQWGLLVLPTETVPISARLSEYMRAALGLQQAGRQLAAIRAFKTATQRWPQRAEVWLGLGNVLYASGTSLAAAEAFRQAIAVDPQCAAAFNNLAHILAESNHLTEAERMARRAVELGGAHSEMYRRTLEEILGK